MRGVLQRQWGERARELGLDTAPPVSRKREPAALAAVPSALEIVGQGMRHLEERQSVFAAGELEAFALAHSPGRHTIGEIRDAVDWMVRDGHLVEADLRRTDRAFVTDRALRAERAVVDMLKAGMGKGTTLAPGGDGRGASGGLASDGWAARRGPDDPAGARPDGGRAGTGGDGEDHDAARGAGAGRGPRGGGPGAVGGGGAGAGARDRDPRADPAMVPDPLPGGGRRGGRT